jgi:hypothetical protein
MSSIKRTFFSYLGGILSGFNGIKGDITSKRDGNVCFQALPFPKGFECMCFDCVWGIEPIVLNYK